MTQEEILDYNKRCAEFLGLKRGWWISQQKPLTDDKKQWCDLDGKTFLDSKVYFDKDLKFHSDWNWIMEVVEAIEKLQFRFEIALNEVNLYCILDERRFSYAINYHDCENYGEEMHLTKKEAVAEAIYNFLKWYNNENNNTKSLFTCKR